MKMLESVIKLQAEELRQDVPDTKLVGKSPDDKVKDEVLYGTTELELGLNVPNKFGTTPVEKEDLTANAYVDCLVVRAWARCNGIATDLMECAERLAISKGMKRIFMLGQK
ncbi:beta-ketoacyl synthase [Tanacetum coccineum]